MKSSRFNREFAKISYAFLISLLCLLSVVRYSQGAAAADTTRTFSTPEAAANALIEMLQKTAHSENPGRTHTA